MPMLIAALALQDGLKPGRFEGKITKSVTLSYLVSVPDDYATSSGKRYPLVIFLHGSGERGSDLEKVKVHGPPKLVAAGRKFSFILVAPQCPDGRSWDPDELNALLNSIERQYRVDRDREYLTGISMGGYGTWALATAQPKRFAAIAPICGGGDVTRAPLIAKVPTWVCHGDKDPSVPFQRSVDMVAALESAGGHPTFTRVEGGYHDVWTQFYLRDDFYDWLLKQKRGAK